MYTEVEEISSMHLTSLLYLLFPTMQCTAMLQPKPGSAFVVGVYENKQTTTTTTKRISLSLVLLPVVCNALWVNCLPVYCSMTGWHTDHSFIIQYVVHIGCSMQPINLKLSCQNQSASWNHIYIIPSIICSGDQRDLPAVWLTNPPQHVNQREGERAPKQHTRSSHILLLMEYFDSVV